MIGDAITWTSRLIFGFIGAAFCCALMPFLACLPLGTNYWICFTVCFPFGAFSGIAQGSIFTMAANLPFKYMGAVMFGNGLAAIFCNSLRAITLIAFPYDPEDSSTFHNSYLGAVVFCCICAAMMFSCVFVQLFILKDN
jgi:hypothetical protein